MLGHYLIGIFGWICGEFSFPTITNRFPTVEVNSNRDGFSIDSGCMSVTVTPCRDNKVTYFFSNFVCNISKHRCRLFVFD